MDPRAWLLKLVIEEIELKQKGPSFYVRSLPTDHCYFSLWNEVSYLLRSSSSSGHHLCHAFELAVLDVSALLTVMERVEKTDNLREVFARAERSIREAILHAGCSFYQKDDSYLLKYVKHKLHAMAATETGSKQEYADASQSDSKLAIAYTLHAFLTSVLHLLTSVFQYLIGYVDRGGSKTYSSGAFDFRASFVALVLFQGAYVWIKFRQAARPDSRKRKAPDVNHEVVDIEPCNLKGIYSRPIREKSSGAITRFKYEPRFSPPRHQGDNGIDVRSKRLPLGEYHTRAEAQIVLQTARYYYGKDGGCVELDNGRHKFFIPTMGEPEQGFAGKAKRKWVTSKAKEVGKLMYAEFRREKEKRLAMVNEADSHGGESNNPSSSALPLPCSSFPVLTARVDELAIGSGAPSLPSVPLPPFDGADLGDAYDFSEAFQSGFGDVLAELINDPGLPNLPNQQSSFVSYQMHYQEFAQLLGIPSLPDVGTVAGGIIEHDSERELNSSPSFQQGRDLADAGAENIDGRVFLPQSVPDLQRLLLFQKKCLEDNARQFVDLDHQLKAQISKLQQEKEQLRTENEGLKSRLEQVAKAQVATWTGIMIDLHQKT